jgi:hypothetical protein
LPSCRHIGQVSSQTFKGRAVHLQLGETALSLSCTGLFMRIAREADSVHCLVPPRGAEPRRVRVSVSINGQDYTAEEIAFSWSEVPLGYPCGSQFATC